MKKQRKDSFFLIKMMNPGYCLAFNTIAIKP